MKRRSKGAYRSGLEITTAADLTKKKINFLYEPVEGKLSWILPATKHTYTPDFWLETKHGKILCIETKGIWDYEDRRKHLLIKKIYPRLDIRFVFTRSSTKTSKGAKQTYADICNGKGRGPFKGITWKYADKRVPLEWLQE